MSEELQKMIDQLCDADRKDEHRSDVTVDMLISALNEDALSTLEVLNG